MTATQKIREAIAKMGEDDETTIKDLAEQAGCTVARVSEVTKLHVEVPLLVRGSKYGMWKRNPEAGDPRESKTVNRNPSGGSKKVEPSKDVYESVMKKLDLGQKVSDAKFEAAREFAKAKRRKQPRRTEVDA
jgi:hypothetical protein